MPIGKTQQNSATLYALITFIGLFIVALICGIIFYVQAEEVKTESAETKSQLAEMVNAKQWRDRGNIVGTKKSSETYLGKMSDYLDQSTTAILGGVTEATSAEMKIEAINAKIKEIIDTLDQYGVTVEEDSNTTGLIRVIELLKAKLNETIDEEAALNDRFTQMQLQFDDAMTASFEKEQTLLEEKEKYQLQIDQIKKDYENLENLSKQTTEQQVQALLTQMSENRTKNRELNQLLMKTQAELKMAEDKIQLTQSKIDSLVPPPDTEVAAFMPDGEIVSIDDSAKVVYLNIGSENHVYQGLTFSVYDKNLPIPKDGIGKAEIEVFNVDKNISTARILRSKINRPILQNDIVANLVWDSKKATNFVVVGEFDINADGVIDKDASEKIKARIVNWGGKVEDMISIKTDFVVLGTPPMVRKKPTFEEIDIDPLAMEKYEQSQYQMNLYEEAKKQSEALSIPVFNFERFLYFIGYKTQSTAPGAF